MKTIAKTFFLIALSYCTLQEVHGQRHVIESYVIEYKDIAVSEMERTGIPASIKLAQAILESDAGRSTLARSASNHFGIKCGGSWSGKTFYREDDDYHKGKLVKSCFRVYSDATESFIEHSEFLRDPKKQYRYGFLFNIDVTDYKSWARGLRKSGYATNPKYASLLIRIIEDYNLSQYDKNIVQKDLEIVAEAGYIPQGKKVNDVSYVLVRKGESPIQISRDFGVSVDRIMDYNENISSRTQQLQTGSRVFIQKKRGSFRGRKKYHYVKEGETMFMISQQYGLRLSSLSKKNKLEVGQEPAIGEKLVLRGLNLFGEAPTLRSKKTNILPPAPKENQSKDPDIEADGNNDVPAEIEDGTAEEELHNKLEIINKVEKDNESLPRYYTVKKGDTLYGISKKYDISIDMLKKINTLSTDVINPGQVIRIK